MAKMTDFSKELVERYGLPEDEALEFVGSMFDIVREQLDTQDKQVKIKGLGTFKVTSVGSRASVDVNTGERIVIEGRNKISFTPETLLRDRVNRPFVQFETVVLNDGVDFSEIDREYKESNDADGDSEGDAEITDGNDVTVGQDAETEDEQKPQDVEELEQNVEEPEQNVENSEQNVEEFDQNVGQHIEPETNIVSADEQEVEPIINEESEHESGQTADEASAPGPKEDSEHSVESDVVPTEESDEPMEPAVSGGCKQRNPRLMYWLTAASFLLLVCIGIGMYVLYQKIEARNTAIEQLQNRLAERVDRHTAVSAAKKAASRKSVAVPAVSVGQDSLVAKTPQQKEEKNLSIHDDEKDIKDVAPAADYSSDVRVRTGAYVIVGTDRVVTVKQGQTLESISRASLGPGMECYIEAYNGCKEVKAGDKLKIPKLKLKKRL